MTHSGSILNTILNPPDQGGQNRKSCDYAQTRRAVNRLRCSRLPDEAILWRNALFRRFRDRSLPPSHAAASFRQNVYFRRYPYCFVISRSPPRVLLVSLAPHLSLSDLPYRDFDDSSPPFLSSITFRSSFALPDVRARQDEHPDPTPFLESTLGPPHTRPQSFPPFSDRRSCSSITFLDPIAGPVENPSLPCSLSPLVDFVLRRNPIPPSRRCETF